MFTLEHRIWMAFVGWENCDSGRTIFWLMLWKDGRRFLGLYSTAGWEWPPVTCPGSDGASRGLTGSSGFYGHRGLLAMRAYQKTGPFLFCGNKQLPDKDKGSVLMCLSVDLSWSHFILAIFHTQMSLSSCLSHFCSIIKLSGLWYWWPPPSSNIIESPRSRTDGERLGRGPQLAILWMMKKPRLRKSG